MASTSSVVVVPTSGRVNRASAFVTRGGDVPRAREAQVLRRVNWVWWLLFLNVLGAPTGGVLHVPHHVAQVITQGSLVAALPLALSVNSRVKVRPSLYLGIFSLLGVTSLMMSVRLVSFGTAARGFRLVAFIAVLWLLTPWWGRRDGHILRAQLKFLAAVLLSVLAGLAISPHRALGATTRLGGVIWPIAATQVAHYTAEFAGVTLVLWAARVVKGRMAVALAVPALIMLLLTHTRTALVAAAVGFVVAALSLVTVRRRVRQMFAAIALAGLIVFIPLSPQVISWMKRGENGTQLSSLSGRTQFWSLVAEEQRPLANEILGNGQSNGSVNDPSNPVTPGAGLPIDSSWVLDYQDEGIAGVVLTGCMFLVLLVCAAYSPRGPARAVALFLVVYCMLASLTEVGAGIASQYAMDLTVAASLLVPDLRRRLRRRRPVVGSNLI